MIKITPFFKKDRSLADMVAITQLLEGKTVTFVGPHAEEDAERIKAKLARMMDWKGDGNE